MKVLWSLLVLTAVCCASILATHHSILASGVYGADQNNELGACNGSNADRTDCPKEGTGDCDYTYFKMQSISLYVNKYYQNVNACFNLPSNNCMQSTESILQTDIGCTPWYMPPILP